MTGKKLSLLCGYLFLWLCCNLSTVAHAFTMNIPSRMNGWRSNPLVFHVNTVDCPSQRDQLNSAVDTAIAMWNSAPTSGLVVSRGSDDTVMNYALQSANQTAHIAREPIIFCDASYQTHTNSLKSPAFEGGKTWSTTSESGIDYATIADFILLDATSGSSSNIGNYSQATLTLIIAHEMGHVLGLGHSSEPSSIMSYSHNSYSSSVQTRLAQDDVDGISYLYPRHEGGGSGGLFGCNDAQAFNGRNSKTSSWPAFAECLILVLASYMFNRLFLKRSRP